MLGDSLAVWHFNITETCHLPILGSSVPTVILTPHLCPPIVNCPGTGEGDLGRNKALSCRPMAL